MKQISFWLFPVFFILVGGIFLLPGVLKQNGIIEVDRPVENALFDKFDKENLLVFFGYVGCRDICTPRLEEIAMLYDSLPPGMQAATEVLFINIKPLGDPDQSGLFSRSFHPAFKGVSLEGKTLETLMRVFDARYSPSMGRTGEYDHTAFLYLLKKEDAHYRIKAIFTLVPFNRKAIAHYLFPEKEDA